MTKDVCVISKKYRVKFRGNLKGLLCRCFVSPDSTSVEIKWYVLSDEKTVCSYWHLWVQIDLKNVFFILYRCRVEEQCCVTFWCRVKWLGYMNTWIYYILFQILSPFRLFQCWAEFPVPCSRSLLVIYFKYSSGYVTVPNSQSVPPPPFPQ